MGLELKGRIIDVRVYINSYQTLLYCLVRRDLTLLYTTLLYPLVNQIYISIYKNDLWVFCIIFDLISIYITLIIDFYFLINISYVQVDIIQYKYNIIVF